MPAALSAYFERISGKWLTFVLILLALAVFLPALNGDFLHWDDDKQITDNYYVKEMTAANISHNFYEERFTFLSLTTFSIEYQIWGDNPLPYKALNILLHIINALLVVSLLRKLNLGKTAVAIAALLFVVHPLRVESVARISERKDLLFTLFFLLACIYYISWLRKNSKWKLILVAAFALFSVFSKVQGIMIVPVLFLLDTYFDKKATLSSIITKLLILAMMLWGTQLRLLAALGLVFLLVLWLDERINLFEIRKKTLITLLIVLLALLPFLFYLAYANNFLNVWPEHDENFKAYGIGERFLLAGYSMSFYLLKLFIPWPLNAVHNYPDFAQNGISVEYWLSILVWIPVLWGLYWSVRKWSSNRLFAFGFVFFLMNISLVLHLLPLEGRLVAGDRYTYLAFIGLFAVAGQVGERFILAYKQRAVFLILTILLVFSALSHLRTYQWKDTRTLFTDVLDKNPGVGFAWMNLGAECMKERKFEQAAEMMNKAIQVSPEEVPAYYNLALAYYNMKDWNKAEQSLRVFLSKARTGRDSALAYNDMAQNKLASGQLDSVYWYLKKSIAVDSTLAQAYNNRGWMLARQNKPDESRRDIEKAIKLDPYFADAWNNLGWLNMIAGDKGKAMSDFSKAIKYNPDYVYAWTNRGYLKAMNGDIDGAVSDYSTALGIDSTSIETYMNRAQAFYSKGKYSDAVNDYRKVLSLDSLHKNARLNLAYACYGAKLPSEAEFHFNEAVRIFGSSADVYESRAWFRLETGRYALSLEDYDHVLKMGQSSPKVWLGRGWVNYYLGNLVEAEADLMKSLGTEGGSPDSWYCLGEICLSSGKKDEACAWFEKAAKAGHPKASELLVINCSN